MTHVFYTKTVNGRTYPKQRIPGKRLVFANDVYRKEGKVVSRYVGIVEAPKDAEVEERDA